MRFITFILFLWTCTNVYSQQKLKGTYSLAGIHGSSSITFHKNGTFAYKAEPNYAGNDPDPELVHGTYRVIGNTVHFIANNTIQELIQDSIKSECMCMIDSSIDDDSIQIGIGNGTFAYFSNVILKTYYDSDTIGTTDTIAIPPAIGYSSYKLAPNKSVSISILIGENNFSCVCEGGSVIILYLKQDHLRWIPYSSMAIIDSKTLKITEADSCCYYRR